VKEQRYMQRPRDFTLNPYSPLMRGLVLAGLGASPGSLRYRDSSAFSNHGDITGTPDLSRLWCPKCFSELGRWGIYSTRDSDSLFIPYRLHMYDANAMSLAFWLKCDDIDFSSGTGYIVSQYDFATNKRQWGLTTRTASPANYEIRTSSDGTATTGKIIINDTGIQMSTSWTHIALHIRARRYYDLYTNGVLRVTVDQGASGTWINLESFFCTAIAGGLANRGPKAHFADLLWRVGSLFSDAEINQLADPSNVMLSGLIQPPRRRLWVPISSVIPGFLSQTRDGRRTGIGAGFGGRR
jgi:hypothetical protein